VKYGGEDETGGSGLVQTGSRKVDGRILTVLGKIKQPHGEGGAHPRILAPRFALRFVAWIDYPMVDKNRTSHVGWGGVTVGSYRVLE
jgi:hypothetical protein